MLFLKVVAENCWFLNSTQINTLLSSLLHLQS